jgi:hypothetical protein
MAEVELRVPMHSGKQNILPGKDKVMEPGAA